MNIQKAKSMNIKPADRAILGRPNVREQLIIDFYEVEQASQIQIECAVFEGASPHWPPI